MDDEAVTPAVGCGYGDRFGEGDCGLTEVERDENRFATGQAWTHGDASPRGNGIRSQNVGRTGGGEPVRPGLGGKFRWIER